MHENIRRCSTLAGDIVAYVSELLNKAVVVKKSSQKVEAAIKELRFLS